MAIVLVVFFFTSNLHNKQGGVDKLIHHEDERKVLPESGRSCAVHRDRDKQDPITVQQWGTQGSEERKPVDHSEADVGTIHHDESRERRTSMRIDAIEVRRGDIMKAAEKIVMSDEFPKSDPVMFILLLAFSGHIETVLFGESEENSAELLQFQRDAKGVES